MNDENYDEVMAIDDPRVPEWVRAHGRGFRQPSAFVEALGEDEYALFASDGELIDLVYRA
ncbi:MAG: hypothetical protein COW59_12745 [Lysobacterales bacterium CG17_big_fil_post_rev_8_21_14_2_50_64_11]|nr:MAG: hypothetical protein COW59_12745 [Xanthomonadales bacterium CG17_big_fil_post_rev_8_21_14_2_50_64_11]PIX60054.1 MAG: hypothetical protein COZ47_09280 [Xanthomonadales bacterium CG_4_10_14_3_um_filter_64_11]